MRQETYTPLSENGREGRCSWFKAKSERIFIVVDQSPACNLIPLGILKEKGATYKNSAFPFSTYVHTTEHLLAVHRSSRPAGVRRETAVHF